MNKLHESMEKTFSDCLELSQRKNADYTGDEDPYKNFRMSEAVDVDVPHGILVRLMDKISRVTTLLDREAQVKDEKIDDTIKDAINYLAILNAYLEHEGEE